MKKLLTLLLFSFGLHAQTVTTTFQNTSICFGEQVTVSYTAAGFGAGTEFKVQLLDKDGGTVLYDNLKTGTASPLVFDATNVRIGAYAVKVTAASALTVSSVASTGLLFVGPYAKMANASGTNTDVTVGADSVSLKVNLYGAAPWVFTYTDGTFQHTVKTSTNPYFFKVKPAQNSRFSLVKVSNACGTNSSLDSRITLLTNLATSLSLPTPTNLNICGGGSVKIPLNYVGDWTEDVTLRVFLTDTNGLYIQNSEQVMNYKTDTVNFLLPNDLAVNKDYKIRVVVTKPYLLINYINSTYKLTATGNNCTPEATLLAAEPSCGGTVLQAYPRDNANTYQYQWFKNNVLQPEQTKNYFFAADSAQYHVKITKAGYNSVSESVLVWQKRIGFQMVNLNPITCDEGTPISLLASSNFPQNEYIWLGDNFSGLYSGGLKIITDETNNTLITTQEGKYAVIIRNQGCEMEITQMVNYGNSDIGTLFLNEHLITNTLNFYAGSNKIISTQTIGSFSNTYYSALESIELKPGFATQQSSIFKAEIKGCPVIPDTVIFKPNVFNVPESRRGDIISITPPNQAISQIDNKSNDNSNSINSGSFGLLTVLNNPLNLIDYSINKVVYSLPYAGYPDGYALRITNRYVNGNSLMCEYEQATMNEAFQVAKISGEDFRMAPNYDLIDNELFGVYDIEAQVGLIRHFVEEPEPYKQKTEVGFVIPNQGKMKLEKEGSKLTVHYAIYDYDEDYETEEDQINLVFSFSYNDELSKSNFIWTDPQLTLSGDQFFSIEGGLEYENSLFDAQEKLTAKYKDFEKLLLNKKIKLMRLPITASATDILIKPYLDIYVNFNLTLDGSLSITAIFENAGIHYDIRNTSTNGIWNPSAWKREIVPILPEKRLEINAAAEASLDLGAGIGITLDFPAFKLINEVAEGEAEVKDSYLGIYTDLNFNATAKLELTGGINTEGECNFSVERSLRTYTYFEGQLNLKGLINWEVKKDIFTPEPLVKFPTLNYSFCEGEVSTNSLKAFYSFMNNTLDESENLNHLVNNGASPTTDAKNNPNSAFSFNGTSSYLSTTSQFLPDIASKRTISLWFKTDGTGYNQNIGTLIDYGLWSENERFAILIGGVGSNLGKGKITFTNLQSQVVDLNGKDYADNSWHHLVVKYGNQEMIVEVDKIQILNFRITLNTNTSQSPLISNFYIGRTIPNSNNILQYFKGSIDQVRVYNRLLSTAELFVIHAEEAPPAPDLTSGLVAHYKFEDNFLDETQNNNDGTESGGVTFENGRNGAGQAIKLNGINQFINVPNSASLDILNDISISVWFNSGNANQSQRIVDKTTVSGADAYMIDFRPSQQIRFIVANSVYDQAQSNAVFTESNKWYLITVTYDSENIKFYKNGVLINTFPKTGSSISNTNPIRFGANSLLNGDWFNGLLDDIRIYNRALTDEEVLQLYNEEKPQPDLTSGLVAHYKFEDNFLDETENNNDGTESGGVTFENGRNGAGKAAKFDGVDDYVILKNSTIGEDFTTSGWCKIETVKYWARLVEFGNGVQNDNIVFALSSGNTGKLVGELYRNNASVGSVISPTNLTLSKWLMTTLVIKGLSIKIYVDGIFVAEGLLSQKINNVLRTQNYIGKSNWSIDSFYQGLLDDIRIYNRALSDEEVALLYKTEKPTEIIDLASGLVAYYPFNGNADDATGNGNNGTVNGPTLTSDRYGNNSNGGQAYSFDGVNDRISKNVGAELSSSEKTISVWAMITGAGNINPRFIGVGPQGTSSQYYSLILEGTASSRRIWFHTSAAVTNSYSNTFVQNSSTWKNYIVTFKNNSVKIFVDGALDKETMTNGSLVSFSTALLQIGYSDNGLDWFEGKLDDIRIYNRALSDAEVKALYNQEKP